MEDGWPFDVHLDDEWRRRCADVAAQLLSDSRHAFFVIDTDEGDALASCVSVSVEQHLPGPDGTGKSSYIGDMCTDERYRGRGYGAQLMQAALDWARAQGVGWVSLFSTDSGRPMYIKAGFSPNGPFEHLSMGLD